MVTQHRHHLMPEVKVGHCCCARLQEVDGHVEHVKQHRNGRARPWKQYGHVPRYRRHGTTCQVETECLSPWMSQMAPEITSISRVSTRMYIVALQTIQEQLHQQNSTFATPSFDMSHEQFSFYSQTQYVKSLFLIQRRFSEIFRQGL